MTRRCFSFASMTFLWRDGVDGVPPVSSKDCFPVDHFLNICRSVNGFPHPTPTSDSARSESQRLRIIHGVDSSLLLEIRVSLPRRSITDSTAGLPVHIRRWTNVCPTSYDVGQILGQRLLWLPFGIVCLFPAPLLIFRFQANQT